MMKEEFEKLVGKEISMVDYVDVEYVYTWHPAISESNGKAQIIAAIYNAGGMVVIRSMKEATTIAQELDMELSEEMRKVERLKARIQNLKNGDITFERCLKDCEKIFNLSETPEQLERNFRNMANEGEYEISMINEAKTILGVSEWQ